jgi:hypothetical protein
VTPGTSAVDGFYAFASDSATFNTAANTLSESPPASPPYVLPSLDDFERAAAEALLNPNPAVEREIFESAFEDDSREPAKQQRSSRGKSAASGQTVTFVNDKGDPVTFVNELGHRVTSDAGPANPAPKAAALEARSQTRRTGSGSLSVNATVKRAKGRRSARTTVGRAVLKNAAEIELIGASFLLLIDHRIELLRQVPRNSDQARAADEAMIAEYEDLRRRVEAFLGATSQFAAKKAPETSVVAKADSLSAGVRDCWSRHHVQFCNGVLDRALKSVDIALFSTGVAICTLAGADANPAVAVPGAMVGGRAVADVIKAFAKRPHTKSE